MCQDGCQAVMACRWAVYLCSLGFYFGPMHLFGAQACYLTSGPVACRKGSSRIRECVERRVMLLSGPNANIMKMLKLEKIDQNHLKL